MTPLFFRTPLYIWHASQKRRLCKITGNTPLVQEILVKDSGFRQQSSYSWLRGEPRNEFCNTFFKKIFMVKYKIPNTTYHILAWTFFFWNFDKKWEIRRTPSKRSTLLFLS